MSSVVDISTRRRPTCSICGDRIVPEDGTVVRSGSDPNRFYHGPNHWPTCAATARRKVADGIPLDTFSRRVPA